jgi:hypothetical protein
MNPTGHEEDMVEDVTARGLKKDMASTSISSDHIATSLIKAMGRRRMYDVPQRDARLNRWLARTFPESFRKFVLYMYRHRLWLFNSD